MSTMMQNNRPSKQEAAEGLVIRAAAPSDQPALRRLAALDSAELPDGELLVAELGGEIRAAVSLVDERAIADPFARTAELVAMLTLRASQLSAGRRRGLRLVARTHTPSIPPRVLRDRAAA